jgi:hypothetical protein
MQILLINPNTSTFVTDRLTAAASRVLEGIATVTGVTAIDGPAIVADREGNLKAAGSTVNLGLLHASAFDAVIVGISTDAGLTTLRRALKQPVVGMLESSGDHRVSAGKPRWLHDPGAADASPIPGAGSAIRPHLVQHARVGSRKFCRYRSACRTARDNCKANRGCTLRPRGPGQPSAEITDN